VIVLCARSVVSGAVLKMLCVFILSRVLANPLVAIGGLHSWQMPLELG